MPGAQLLERSVNRLVVVVVVVVVAADSVAVETAKLGFEHHSEKFHRAGAGPFSS